MKNKPRIVCAACKNALGLTLVGARHWDMLMNKQARAMGIRAPNFMDQVFIDQFGKFYNRKDAMKIVKESGQPFDEKRNGGNGEDLYSEGLY